MQKCYASFKALNPRDLLIMGEAYEKRMSKKALFLPTPKSNKAAHVRK